MESDAGTCAVHTMTLENVKTLQSDVKIIQDKVTTIETKIATIQERIDWVKAIVWLVAASLIGSVINIIMTASK